MNDLEVKMADLVQRSPVEKKHVRHEEEILKYFGPDFMTGGIEKTQFAAFRPYLLVFTNRSGSNALAEDMRISLGVGSASEKMNSPDVINQSRSRGFDFFDQYLYWVFSSQNSDVPGIKASVDQLLFLYSSGVLQRCFRCPEIIFIERRDLLAQAISMFIARETGQWTIWQKKVRKEPDFDRDTILMIQKSIADANARFGRFASLVGVEAFRVVYEDYCKDRGSTLSALAERLDVVYKGEPSAGRKKVTRQLSRTKDLYHQYILDEFATGFRWD